MPRKELLDEIPPDPVNFLREEGDVDKLRHEPNQNQRPPSNNSKHRNFNRNRQEWPKQEKSNNDDAITADSPPRPRNRPRPQTQQQQQQNRSPQDESAPRRQIHPQQLRSERRSAQTHSEEYQYQQQQKTGQPHQQHTPNRQRRSNNRPPNKEGGDRNNITVEFTDEVRSVKCKTCKLFRFTCNSSIIGIFLLSNLVKSTEKTFGTGRVGYSRSDNVQKFTVDTFNPEIAGDHPQRNDGSPSDKTHNRILRNNHNRRNQKPKEFTHPTLENIIITKANVQDRLLKIANKDSEPKFEAQAAQKPQPDNGN